MRWAHPVNRSAVDGLRVLTWHVHGNYLWYLSRVPVTWYVPVRPGRPPGYGGRGTSFPFPPNVVGTAPTAVIEHGVSVPDVEPTLERARGLVVVNDLATRGRRLGADLVAFARERVPLDIVGMNSETVGGLGEVPPPELPAFMARYRFFFHPARYTSLGLAVCEAMSVGVPVVGLATTELATVIDDGRTGYIDTDVDRLVRCMAHLLDRRDVARELGARARTAARRRFAIERFAADWSSLLHEVARTGVNAASAW